MTNGDSRNERLDSWKEIARYLNRSERTVQRWERESGLPIRRVKSAKDAGSVYAMRSELDAWLLEGNVSGDGQAFDRPRAGTSKRKSTLVMLAGLAALLALTALAATLRLGPWTPPSAPTPVALTRDSDLLRFCPSVRVLPYTTVKVHVKLYVMKKIATAQNQYP